MKNKYLFIFFSIFPWLIALYYSFGEAIATLWDVYQVDLSLKTPLNMSFDPDQYNDIKRKIQGIYRQKNVFVAIEDIIIFQELDNLKTQNNIIKLCNEAPLYVFVPLPIKIPILGKKHLELCLKPRIK